MSDFVATKFREGEFKILFLGTGVSTAIPNIFHMVVKSRPGKPSEGCCKVCNDAMDYNSKNRRNNVSIAILFLDPINGSEKCVMVDCGKTMRDACIRLLPKNGIVNVDAILLTHGHADAILGLDDVRDLQESVTVTVPHPSIPSETSVGFKIVSGPLPIFLHAETMKDIKNKFDYLTEPPKYLDKDNHVIERRVALLDFQVIDVNESFRLFGLPIRSFPVWHGGTCKFFLITRNY